MNRWLRALTWAWLLAACGGVTRHDAPTSPGSGGQLNASGGQAPMGAGSSGIAGDASLVGNAGGAGNAGSSGLSGTTMGGDAGTLVDECSLAVPISGPGPCEAIVEQYSHDPATQLCLPQLSNWCERAPNVFPSWDACHASCPDSATSLGACETDADCTLLTTPCACEPIDELALVPINLRYASAYAARWGDVSCPGCSAGAPHTSQYFMPKCDAGACRVLDIRASSFTDCVTDDDCRLRDGTACCPSCSGAFVAVNVNADFCAATPNMLCPRCMLSTSKIAACSLGHCRIVDPTAR